jgi:hypothetical protein
LLLLFSVLGLSSHSIWICFLWQRSRSTHSDYTVRFK